MPYSCGRDAILRGSVLRDLGSIVELVARIVYVMIKRIRRLQLTALQHQFSFAALRLDLNQQALAQIARTHPQRVQLVDNRNSLMHDRQSRDALVRRSFNLAAGRACGNIHPARHRGLVFSLPLIPRSNGIGSALAGPRA